LLHVAGVTVMRLHFTEIVLKSCAVHAIVTSQCCIAGSSRVQPHAAGQEFDQANVAWCVCVQHPWVRLSLEAKRASQRFKTFVEALAAGKSSIGSCHDVTLPLESSGSSGGPVEFETQHMFAKCRHHAQPLRQPGP